MTSSQAGQRVFDGTNTSPRSKKSAREAPTSVVCCSALVAGFVNIQPSRPQTCCLNAHVTDRTMTRMQLKFENDYVTFALTHLCSSTTILQLKYHTHKPPHTYSVHPPQHTHTYMYLPLRHTYMYMYSFPLHSYLSPMSEICQ